MKNLSTSELVEKAIARLRERYGVLGGLITEPEIVRISTESKVVHTVALLKAFNEDMILWKCLLILMTRYFFLFYLYIYPPVSQESDGGAIHRVGNYPDLLPEMPRYCCPLVI